MFHNKKDFTEEIFLDRDTSQPKEKFKFRKKINESQVQRSFNKSSNFKFKFFLIMKKITKILITVFMIEFIKMKKKIIKIIIIIIIIKIKKMI